MRLNGKIAIITGAASGIGQGVATRFAAEGCAVFILDLNEESGRQTQDAIRAKGGEATFRYADVSRPDHWSEVVAEVLERHGRIDILHNNAARIIYGKNVLQTSEEDWDNELETTLKGAFLGCKAVLPAMVAQSSGSIINTSSTAGISGVPRFAAYSAAKGGVIQLTRSIAVDFGRSGIRANAICPGVIETPAIRSLLEKEEYAAATRSRLMLNRIGQPDDIASAAVFLGSDESGFVTGAVLVVDGGRTVAY